AVGRFGDVQSAGINDLGIARINANLAVIHRAVVVVTHQTPGLALVVRAPDAASLRVWRLIGLRLLAAAKTAAARLLFTAARPAARSDFDLRVDDVRVRARDIEADAPQQDFGYSGAFELGPRLAGVNRLPDCAAGTAAIEPPVRAAALVRRGVKRLRVNRINHDVGQGGVFVNELDVGPRLTAVGGLVDATFFVRTEQTSERRDINRIRVLRINDDTRDGLCLFQPDVSECLAAVGRFIDPVAESGTLAVVRLARADPDDIRIGLANGDVAD